MLKRLTAVLLIGIAMIPATLSQSASDYQTGTIMNVVKHPGSTAGSLQYDVSVRVLNTLYTVLYTPPPGVNSVEYFKGLELLVLVKKDTLVFNSRVSGTTEVPILKREALARDDGIDLSKAPSQYYSMKLRNLSDKLSLSEDQQARIRPILEQEAGELNVVWNNPALSQKDKIDRLRRAVRASDQKMKPLLSQAQWDKLESLRQEQEQELKNRVEANKPPQQK